MHFTISENKLSLRESFFIKDSRNEHVYSILGKILFAGQSYKIIDKNKQVFAHIKRKFLSFTPFCYIYINTESPFSIRRALSLNQSYMITGKDWRLSTNHNGREYFLFDGNGGKIMKFNPKFNTWGFNYELDVYQLNYLIHCLCIAFSVLISVKAIDKIQNK